MSGDEFYILTSSGKRQTTFRMALATKKMRARYKLDIAAGSSLVSYCAVGCSELPCKKLP
jgi:hypothetical protein